jgi:hypothetical protein
MIILHKFSQMDSLEKFLMPKTLWGLTIGDMLVVDKMIFLTFLDFPDPDKAHRSFSIYDFFTPFVNVYPSHLFMMLKGIGYLLKLCANNLHKPTPPSANADQGSMINDCCNYVVPLLA